MVFVYNVNILFVNTASVYKPFANKGFIGFGLINCNSAVNCGGNVLKSVTRWFIVRPSSKSKLIDKSNSFT